MTLTCPFANLRGGCILQNHKLPYISLPNDDHEEVNVLARQHGTSPVPVQTISFMDLPAELRNRIYEHVLASSQDQLIIATPFRDELMSFGAQPGITRVSKQVRFETLEMFYTNSTFVAYIQDVDFDPLVDWVNSITAYGFSPKVRVEVKLLDRIKCAYELLSLVRLWKDTEHQTIHLRIHNCYTDGTGTVFRVAGFDQRKLVAEAVNIAERLRKQGETTEEELLIALHRQFENIDRWYLYSHAEGTEESCLFEGAGAYHPTRVRTIDED